jgi:hypothetical protein
MCSKIICVASRTTVKNRRSRMQVAQFKQQSAVGNRKGWVECYRGLFTGKLLLQKICNTPMNLNYITSRTVTKHTEMTNVMYTNVILQ